jgi:hypothetical protein
MTSNYFLSHLGFVLSKGISPNSDKVKAIVEMPFPSTAK